MADDEATNHTRWRRSMPPASDEIGRLAPVRVLMRNGLTIGGQRLDVKAPVERQKSSYGLVVKLKTAIPAGATMDYMTPAARRALGRKGARARWGNHPWIR